MCILKIMNAVLKTNDFLERYKANLLGLGMHPVLNLDEVQIWSHRDRGIYDALGNIFNLKQHGWLNIQSFQLNLPYASEKDGIKLHNTLSTIIPYLPAISAASPVYEWKIGEFVDNRLHFYMVNQKEVPSIVGEGIPEQVSSFGEYHRKIIDKYSRQLKELHAHPCLIGKDWVNSRGITFRFGRKSIEIRVLDEQECIKSDVALSCFIRALVRGLINQNRYLPHDVLVEDFRSVIKDGFDAKVGYLGARNARDVCLQFYRTADKNAEDEEKKYLWLVKKRIEKGNLSNLIVKDIKKRAMKTSLEEAILNIYLRLVENLRDNKPYF